MFWCIFHRRIFASGAKNRKIRKVIKRVNSYLRDVDFSMLLQIGSRREPLAAEASILGYGFALVGPFTSMDLLMSFQVGDLMLR